MVDISTGIVRVNRNLIFTPSYTYEDFKKTPYFNGQNSIQMIYIDEKQIINNRSYMVSFFFMNEKIYMVSLVNCDEEISAKEEKKRKRIHDEILYQEGIVSGKEYNWGKVKSEYDARSNVSSINIYYKM